MLAYALAVIYTGDRMSITPRWVQMNYPEIDNVVRTLCNIPCKEGTLMEQAQCYLEQKRNQPKTYSIIKKLLYENQQ